MGLPFCSLILTMHCGTLTYFYFFSDALSPRVLNIHCMPWIIASFVRTEQIIIHAHIWLYMLPLHVPEHIRCNFEVSKFPTNLTMTKVLLHLLLMH